jgi:hypothetical protein
MFFKSLQQKTKNLFSKDTLFTITQFINSGIFSYLAFSPASLVELACTTLAAWSFYDTAKALAQKTQHRSQHSLVDRDNAPDIYALAFAKKMFGKINLANFLNLGKFFVINCLPVAAAQEINTYFAQTTNPATIYHLYVNELVTQDLFHNDSLQAFFPCQIHNLPQLHGCLAKVCGDITTDFPTPPKLAALLPIDSRMNFFLSTLWELRFLPSKLDNLGAVFFVCVRNFVEQVVKKTAEPHGNFNFMQFITEHPNLLSSYHLSVIGAGVILFLLAKPYAARLARELYSRYHPTAQDLENAFNAPNMPTIPQELFPIIASHVSDRVRLPPDPPPPIQQDVMPTTVARGNNIHQHEEKNDEAHSLDPDDEKPSSSTSSSIRMRLH